MTFSRARLACACAMIAMPAAAIAQSRSETVFSRSRAGTVSIRAAVVLADYTVKPLPLLTVVARRKDRADSVAGRTDLDGRLSMSLPAGAYTILARAPQPINGRVFAWAVPITVRASATEAVQLTNANASADSIAVVASAPAPRPQSQSQPTNVARPEPAATPVAAPAAAPVAAPVERPTAPPIATAQVSAGTTARANTSKLFLGLALNGSAITSDELSSDTRSGGGLSAQLGWGFTKHFALVLDMSGASIRTDAGDFALGHFDIGARWHFVSSSRALVPFLEAAYGGRAAVEQDVILSDGSGNLYQGDLSIAGTGFSFGGGLQYHVAPKWALGGSLKWTTGEFSRVQFDNVSVDGLELDATSARFNLGFSWYPMGGSRP